MSARFGARFAAVAVVTVVLSGLLAAPVLSQDTALTAEELGIEAVAGFAPDQVVGGAWVPLEIRLAPTRLFAGTLTIRAEHSVSQVIESRQVEVPAGSEKRFRFLLPPTEDIRVRIDEAGRDPYETRVRLRLQTAVYVIGVLGGLPATLPNITDPLTQTRATVVPVDAAWLDEGPRVLSSLGALIVTDADLAALPDASRGALAAAVGAGLEVVVTVTRDGPVDLGLPWNPVAAATTSTSGPVLEATEGALTLVRADLARLGRPADDPSTGDPSQADGDAAATANGAPASDEAATDGDDVVAAAVPAGRGRVTATRLAFGDSGEAADARFWSQVAPLSAGTTNGTDSSSDVHRITQLSNEALSGAALTLPSLPWLGAFLLAYVLLVGPVNAFVLRRIGRRELAWATVPAVTAVFALSGFLAATGSQPPVGLAAEARWWIDGTAGQLTSVVLRAPTAGLREVRFEGDGWSVLPEAYNGPTELRSDATSTLLRLPLEALNVGTVLAWRDEAHPQPLDVTATATGDDLTIEIVNVSEAPVTDLTVRVATSEWSVADLDPGERVTETFDLPNQLPTRDPYDDQFRGLRNADGMPRAPESLVALLRWGVLDGSPGMVTVTGISAGAGAIAAEVDGRPVDDLGTLLSVSVTPRFEPGSSIHPAFVARELRASGNFGGTWRPGPLSVEGGGSAVLRFQLPVSGVTSLVSHLDRDQFGGRMPFDVMEECFEQPVFDIEGNQIGGEVVCEDTPVPAPIPIAPPECPANAECSFDGDTFEVCFEDGTCSVEFFASPEPFFAGFRTAFEVWDHGEAAWVLYSEVFAPEADGRVVGDATRIASPLGDIYVRVTGELFPFDYSGRGIAGITGGAA